MDALWHVVLIKFKSGASQQEKDAIYERYQTLAADAGGKDAGILFFKVERNLDLRKGVELVQIAIFEDNDAVQRYRFHPAHAALAGDLSKIADWQVGDMMLPYAL